VLWAGLAGDLAALGDLQRAVTDATRPLGFVPEERPFAPHLTLGRARQDVGAAQIQALAAALRAAAPAAPVAWDAGRPLLFESVSTPGGVVYRAIGP
jgi:2'-5' RNA ligase